MTRKEQTTSRPSSTEARKGKKTRRKDLNRTLVKAASLVILGSALLAAEQCQANDYVVPYISIEKKPARSIGELKYSESTQKVKELASRYSGVLRPEFQEAYLNSILLDFDASSYTVAITDCGQCLCAACSCSVASCAVPACAAACAMSCAASCAVACAASCAAACACTCTDCSGTCGCAMMCGANTFCGGGTIMCGSCASSCDCSCASMCGGNCHCSSCSACMNCTCGGGDCGTTMC